MKLIWMILQGTPGQDIVPAPCRRVDTLPCAPDQGAPPVRSSTVRVEPQDGASRAHFRRVSRVFRAPGRHSTPYFRRGLARLSVCHSEGPVPSSSRNSKRARRAPLAASRADTLYRHFYGGIHSYRNTFGQMQASFVSTVTLKLIFDFRRPA